MEQQTFLQKILELRRKNLERGTSILDSNNQVKINEDSALVAKKLLSRLLNIKMPTEQAEKQVEEPKAE